MNDIHTILFNWHILYSVILGIWAGVMAAQNKSISGNFWGAVIISALLAGSTLALGILMLVLGYELRTGRTLTYILYMAWLTVIMPGLFSLLKGRDDRSAAIAFSILAFFNASTSVSMFQRGLVSPWLEPV